MKLSEELSWRGFVNQTTLTDPTLLDKRKFIFYWGVDPSSDSMTVGNLATAMMVKHFIRHGHKAVLLVGGATGMIGDPDGKSEERKLKTLETIAANKKAIVNQYKNLFAGLDITIVDNHDWFKNYNYLAFLRDVGKHVTMRQMLGREFVQSRLGEQGSGISYAEFSYVLMQAYDFLYLHNNFKVDLQVCGSDQWGNSIAGVDLIRRMTGDVVEVWSSPLVVNPLTGAKFGKSEDGAVWLDANKTSPTSFHQFWVNTDDRRVEYYLKIYTELSPTEVALVMQEQTESPKTRPAQFKLADEVTAIVHGRQAAAKARRLSSFISGITNVGQADQKDLEALRQEIPYVRINTGQTITDVLIESKLAASKTAAKRFIDDGAVYLNGARIDRDKFIDSDFTNNRLMIRRGKAYKDSAMVELESR